MTAEHAVGLRDPHDLGHARQHLHLFDRQRRGIADQVDFRQRDLAADFPMDAERDVGKPLELGGQLAGCGIKTVCEQPHEKWRRQNTQQNNQRSRQRQQSENCVSYTRCFLFISAREQVCINGDE